MSSRLPGKDSRLWRRGTRFTLSFCRDQTTQRSELVPTSGQDGVPSVPFRYPENVSRSLSDTK